MLPKWVAIASPMASEKAAYVSQLVQGCLHLGEDVSIIKRCLEQLQSVDGADLQNYFDYETRLAPPLLWHLKRQGFVPLLKEPLATLLGQRYQVNVARNFLLEQNIAAFLKHFNREGIETVLLKGAAGFTARLSLFRDAFAPSDVDLLVRPQDMNRAARLLILNGYTFTESDVLGGQTKQEFVSAASGIHVDLHSSLFWVSLGVSYRDYVPTDPFKESILTALCGQTVRILSPEDQVCYRLVHDAIGHEVLLLSSIHRLFYFSLLTDFYRAAIDWKALLERLAKKGSDRLLVAYIYYANRELGLTLPTLLEQSNRRGPGDLAYLDAVVSSSERLANYTNRVSIAVLTARNRRERLRTISQLLVRDTVVVQLQRRRRKQGVMIALHDFRMILRMFCLQLIAALYVGGYSLRYSKSEARVNVG